MCHLPAKEKSSTGGQTVPSGTEGQKRNVGAKVTSSRPGPSKGPKERRWEGGGVSAARRSLSVRIGASRAVISRLFLIVWRAVQTRPPPLFSPLARPGEAERVPNAQTQRRVSFLTRSRRLLTFFGFSPHVVRLEVCVTENGFVFLQTLLFFPRVNVGRKGDTYLRPLSTSMGKQDVRRKTRSMGDTYRL